ncbi:unnamed protein product [Pipistrellus nathusii]|uniref:G-protein coupled receptors family 1 profile domain-containing protein n=1 Tax=Pipistrellus nathusii TaxID=59473 RepID=A0ABP0AK63_PIPNA
MDMTVTAWETELTPTDESNQDFYQHYTGEIILQILTVIVALVGLAGNAVVLWLLGFQMGRNAFSVYILNLAGANFLFHCCHIIHVLSSIFNFVIEIIFRFLPPVAMFAYISGMSILSAISTEHCMSVLWPNWYRCRHPTHLSSIMCALLWALSLLWSMLKENYCSFPNWSVHRVWCQVMDFITVAWLILLFVLLSGSSLALMTRLMCGSQRVPPTRQYMTVLLTVLLFKLCSLPIVINWFLIVWFPNKYRPLFHIHMTVFLLSCVNSCANHFITFFVSSFRQRCQKQRHPLRLALQRALQDTPEVDEPGKSLPGETLCRWGSSLGQ